MTYTLHNADMIAAGRTGMHPVGAAFAMGDGQELYSYLRIEENSGKRLRGRLEALCGAYSAVYSLYLRFFHCRILHHNKSLLSRLSFLRSQLVSQNWIMAVSTIP